MSVIFIFLFLLFIVNTLASSLWKDSYDTDHDVTHFTKGENLVYFASGSVQFNVDVAAKVADEFRISPENVFCFGVSDIVKPSVVYDKLLKNSPITTLVVVSDVQLVEGDFNRKGLDFIFRISDSSSEYSKVIILLLYDSQSSSVVLSEENWKQVLSERLNSDSQYVNGYALTGRINRSAIEVKSDSLVIDIETTTLTQFCLHVNSRQLSAKLLKIKDSTLSKFQNNWFIALAILLPVGGILYAFGTQPTPGKSQTIQELPIIRPQDTTNNDNTLKDIKIVASASTASLPSVVGTTTTEITPAVTPTTTSFDSTLFRSDYHNNVEGRTGTSYYGEGSVSSADKAAAVAQLLMSEETLSVTGSVNSKHSHSGNGKRSSSSTSKKTSAIFSIANRLSFGESSSSPSSIRSPEVTAVTTAHAALFSQPLTRITTVPEDSTLLEESDASPHPVRDISKIHVTIDESIAPVRIRGRRKATPPQVEDSPVSSRRQTRSQDMTTRSGAVLGGSGGLGGPVVRRGRAKSDQARNNKKFNIDEL